MTTYTIFEMLLVHKQLNYFFLRLFLWCKSFLVRIFFLRISRYLGIIWYQFIYICHIILTKYLAKNPTVVLSYEQIEAIMSLSALGIFCHITIILVMHRKYSNGLKMEKKWWNFEFFCKISILTCFASSLAQHFWKYCFYSAGPFRAPPPHNWFFFISAHHILLR